MQFVEGANRRRRRAAAAVKNRFDPYDLPLESNDRRIAVRFEIQFDRVADRGQFLILAELQYERHPIDASVIDSATVKGGGANARRRHICTCKHNAHAPAVPVSRDAGGAQS